MRILIAGIGEVGANIASEIEGGKHEMVLVDLNDDNLRAFSGKMGIETFHGDISTLPYFKSRDPKQFDMFFAITESDEVNMLACSMAKRFKIPVTVCRMQKVFKHGQDRQGMQSILGIDFLVNPIEILVQRLMEIYRAPNLFDRFPIFDGKLNIYGFHVRGYSRIKGKTLANIMQMAENTEFGVCFLIKNKTQLTRSDDAIAEEGDSLYFYAETDALKSIRHFLGYAQKKLKRVVIVGGGRIGLMLALHLEKENIRPVVAEYSLEKCQELASILVNSTVLNLDGTDKRALQNERLHQCDLYLALTNNDAANIISCHLATEMGVGNTVCLVQEATTARMVAHEGHALVSLSPRLTMKNYITNLFPDTFLKHINVLNFGHYQIVESETSEYGIPHDQMPLFQMSDEHIRCLAPDEVPTTGSLVASIAHRT